MPHARLRELNLLTARKPLIARAHGMSLPLCEGIPRSNAPTLLDQGARRAGAGSAGPRRLFGRGGSAASARSTATAATMMGSGDGGKARRPDRDRLVADAAVTEGESYKTVGDVMTYEAIYSCSPDSNVLDALKLIVEHRITGLAVVDEDNKVIGVVSDFDLLAMDVPSLDSYDTFPSLDQSWQTFMELRKLMTQFSDKIVRDVMTSDPLVVRPNTSLDSAIRLLVQSRIRRLPVVDKDGKLLGMLSRHNLLSAALRGRRAADNEIRGRGIGDAAFQS